MIQADPRFRMALLGSLLVHLALLGLLALIPSGGSPGKVAIYTVHMVEAPQIPQAHQLDLSPILKRELKLSPPAFGASPLPDEPQAPDLEPPPAPRPTLRAGSAKAPALPLPAPLAPGARPQAQPAGEAADAALPQIPAAPAARRAAPQAPAARAPAARAPAADSAVADLADGPTPMEKLRSKVNRLDLQVEAAEGESQASTRARADGEKSLIDMRLFQNTVRERVKENYTFPGTFPPNLRTRVRVEIDREGRIQSLQVIESSRNARFDALVCLAAIRKAKLPPVPESVETPTVVLNLTCAP